jgi:hypothetical protein
VICIGMWCIYHGFGLIEFEVAPCPESMLLSALYGTK